MTLLATSCTTTSDLQWKQKKMLKQDRKMMRKVHNARKFNRK